LLLTQIAMLFACFPIVQAGPVREEQQVEEDWMQQVSLRMVGLAGERQTRPELDAIGACDGVINGELLRVIAKTDPLNIP